MDIDLTNNSDKIKSFQIDIKFNKDMEYRYNMADDLLINATKVTLNQNSEKDT